MRPPFAQRGIALITGLLLLLVVTLVAVAMFHGFGDQEQIAGNTREKQRAINAAVSAQNYAEWFLAQGIIPATISCTTTVPSSTVQICNNPPTDFTVTPWTVGNTFTPFTTADGKPLEPSEFRTYLRNVSGVRRNQEFNGLICRGLLAARNAR